MRLYSEANAIGSHRVRLLLAEKSLPVELELVDPDDVPEDLIHLNPYTSLPTLVDRDLVLYDAKVISEYLDERYPHPPMLPIEPVSRGKSRLTLYRIEKDWYSLLPDLVGSGPRAERACKTLVDSLVASADVFRLKPYFLSDEYSLLDASLAPFLWRFPQMGIDLPVDAQPVIDYAERLFARPGFQASLTDAEKQMG